MTGDSRNARTASALGDTHNFGRHVERRGGRIVKPRPVFWEWLFLSAESPLRRALAAASAGDPRERGAFDFLPDLSFDDARALAGGTVEEVRLAPIGRVEAEARAELARVLGRATALFAWMGVTDLHWENLALGRSARGTIQLFPLDVEMILDDFARPTETKLLPEIDDDYSEIYRHAAGARRVLPWLGKPARGEDVAAMAHAYVQAIDLLERHAPALAEAIGALPSLREMPIRVLLRATGDYVRARSEAVWPPLLDAEAEQLARGDIPYFFRLYGAPGIRYYQDARLRDVGRLPLRGDVPQLAPLLSIARGLRHAEARRLREEGMFALVGAFDPPSARGAFEDGAFRLAFGARTLTVTLPSGEELETRRNLRAFVGSIYSPCACGEVKSVLVPAVTRCTTTATAPRH